MIQHDVDDHTSDGNVEPEGQSPSSDAAMAVKLFTQGARQRDEHKRKNYDRKKYVRDEQGEIHRPDPSLPEETDIADADVIDDVRNQERRGSDKRRHHEESVSGNLALADHDESAHQQSRT